MENLTAFLGDHQSIVALVSVLSTLFFIGSLFVIPVMVSRLPVDYFIYGKRIRRDADNPRTFTESSLVLLKNITGVILVLLGIAMLVLPGQGLLTILIGLSLCNFPGKYALERKIVRTPSIFRGLNWLRNRAGKPPLELPD